MSTFHDLLAQLSTSHDKAIARLEQQREDLREELSALHAQLNRGTELWDSEIAPETLLSPSFSPEAFHSVCPQEVVLQEPRSLIFRDDVQQLGFRVFWGAQRPSIQKVDEGSAAHARGLCEGDVLLSINCMSTFGQPREKLLPLLKVRPLRLDLESQEILRLKSNESQQLKAPTAPSPQKAVTPPSPRKTDLAEAVVADIGERTLKSPRNSQKQVMRGQDDADDTGGKEALVNAHKLDFNDEKAPWYSVIESLLAREPQFDTPAARRCLECCAWFNELEEPTREGPVSTILCSRWFSTLGLCVILTHAMLVTAFADFELAHGGEEAPAFFQVCEAAFLGFYAFELVLKFYVHRCFFFLNEQRSWNMFDLFLVMVSCLDLVMTYAAAEVGEGSGEGGGNVAFMRVFRLFKIAKVLRTVRVIKAFRKLRQMLESFQRCFLSMFWGLVLLIFFLYIFSLVFAQGVAACLMDSCSDEEVMTEMRATYSSVSSIMLSLYMAVTGGNDWVEYYAVLKNLGGAYGLIFLLYTFFFVFALFNIMTGVFVESAMVAALPDRDEIIMEERRRLAQQVEDFRILCHQLDSDNSGYIGKHEFMEHMKCPSMVSYMSHLGLQLYDIDHFFRTIAREGDEVDIDAFVEGCMTMKGNATGVDVQKQIFESKQIKEKVDKVLHLLAPKYSTGSS